MCRAQSSVDRGDRVAVRSSQFICPFGTQEVASDLSQSPPHVSIQPGPSQSLSDASEFDLTYEDSDRDSAATQLDTQVSESDATPSLDEVDRRPVGNSGTRAVPWTGGTSSFTIVFPQHST